LTAESAEGFELQISSAKSETITNIDELVKSPKVGFSVIPAKAGIQFFPPVMSSLDSGFHRSDDFLRNHQFWCFTFKILCVLCDLCG